MSAKINLDNIAIVLQQPRYPENIGSAARAASNMGIGRLRVVNPENYDLVKIKSWPPMPPWMSLTPSKISRT